MKKIISFLILLSFFSSTYSYTDEELAAADFLAYKWVIVAQDDHDDYKLSETISRREMLKVMILISWKEVWESCSEVLYFSDMWSDDRWCKYGEVAVDNAFIANNVEFRPDDSITKVESLKMIMKAVWVEKDDTYLDWRKWYVWAWEKIWIIDAFFDYDTNATRGWIFQAAKNAMEQVSDDDMNVLDFFLKQ